MSKVITSGKEYENFRSKFEKDKKEMLVLMFEDTNGATVIGDILRPSTEFIAAVDLETGELSEEKGRLEWLITKDNSEGYGWGYDLRQFTVCHIRARKNNPVALSENEAPVMNNRYMLTEVIDDGLTDERLEKLREKYLRPVYIEDDEIGQLVLEREFSWFTGYIPLLGKNAVYIDTDEENGATADKTFASLKNFYLKAKELDEKYRRCAAEQLTDTVNEWKVRDEPFTKEEFYDMIAVSSIRFYRNGNIEVYYTEDTGLFGDFGIEVKTDVNSGFIDVVIT